MRTTSFMMEMGVQIDWVNTKTYPMKKIGKEMVPQKHLGTLTDVTTYSITVERETHHFDDVKDALKFAKTTKMYKARLAYEIENNPAYADLKK